MVSRTFNVDYFRIDDEMTHEEFEAALEIISNTQKENKQKEK